MGNYPHTEATMRAIDEAIELAKSCQHADTKTIQVPEQELDNGTVIDSDVIEVCTAYYCGAITRSGL